MLGQWSGMRCGAPRRSRIGTARAGCRAPYQARIALGEAPLGHPRSLPTKPLHHARGNPATGNRARPSLFDGWRVIFSEIGGRRLRFLLVAVPHCDSVTIRAHWRMTTNCPDSAHLVPGPKTAPENLVRKVCRHDRLATRPGKRATGQQHLGRIRIGFQRSSAPHRRFGVTTAHRPCSPALRERHRDAAAGYTKVRAICMSFASH
jgi:hypothetical protein